jgi:error-prone DNA polymerase
LEIIPSGLAAAEQAVARTIPGGERCPGTQRSLNPGDGASAWFKCWHPDVFCAALLNSQPMGFYAPAQIVRDAIQHGVDVHPVCINASRWDCTLEPSSDESRFAVRLGMRMVKGLANAHAPAIVESREFRIGRGLRAGAPARAPWD